MRGPVTAANAVSDFKDQGSGQRVREAVPSYPQELGTRRGGDGLKLIKRFFLSTIKWQFLFFFCQSL